MAADRKERLIQEIQNQVLTYRDRAGIRRASDIVRALHKRDVAQDVPPRVLARMVADEAARLGISMEMDGDA